MTVKIISSYKVNCLRRFAEDSGDERDAIWLVHPAYDMWGYTQPICFHRVGHSGRPAPWAGHVELTEFDGPYPNAGYVWVDVDGTVHPTDEYGEPDERYYSYATLFGFH